MNPPVLKSELSPMPYSHESDQISEPLSGSTSNYIVQLRCIPRPASFHGRSYTYSGHRMGSGWAESQIQARDPLCSQPRAASDSRKRELYTGTLRFGVRFIVDILFLYIPGSP